MTKTKTIKNKELKIPLTYEELYKNTVEDSFTVDLESISSIDDEVKKIQEKFLKAKSCSAGETKTIFKEIIELINTDISFIENFLNDTVETSKIISNPKNFSIEQIYSSNIISESGKENHQSYTYALSYILQQTTTLKKQLDKAYSIFTEAEKLLNPKEVEAYYKYYNLLEFFKGYSSIRDFYEAIKKFENTPKIITAYKENENSLLENKEKLSIVEVINLVKYLFRWSNFSYGLLDFIDDSHKIILPYIEKIGGEKALDILNNNYLTLKIFFHSIFNLGSYNFSESFSTGEEDFSKEKVDFFLKESKKLEKKIFTIEQKNALLRDIDTILNSNIVVDKILELYDYLEKKSILLENVNKFKVPKKAISTNKLSQSILTAHGHPDLGLDQYSYFSQEKLLIESGFLLNYLFSNLSIEEACLFLTKIYERKNSISVKSKAIKDQPFLGDSEEPVFFGFQELTSLVNAYINIPENFKKDYPLEWLIHIFIEEHILKD